MRVWLFILSACGSAPLPSSPSGDTATAHDPAAQCAHPGSYASVGQPFLLTYCTACHSSQLDGSARYGAPAEVDLDSLADVQRWADRVLDRTISTADMPPGGGASKAELERLAVWLHCGAPGDDNPLPAGTHDSALRSALALAARVDDHDGVLEVSRIIEGDGTEEWSGTYTVHRMRVDASAAWMDGYSEYGAQGVPVRDVSFDPALQIIGDEGQEQSILTTTIDADGAETQRDEWWIVDRSSPDLLPGQLVDPSPELILAVEAGGAEQGWYTSADWGISARWWLSEDGQLVETHGTSSEVMVTGTGPMPLANGMLWIERGVLSEVGP